MRVCLIGATHPCHNPRLVREADALAERGDEVRVLAVRAVPGLVAEDDKLVALRGWRLQTASILRSPLHNRIRALPNRLRRAVAAREFRRSGSLEAAENALCEVAPQLLRLALAERADWFIAHTQTVLAVAAHAARRWKARLGFDCEDLLAEVDISSAEMVRFIERTYLPACDYVSTASHAMAARLQQQYKVAPTVLYNVFPRMQVKGLLPPSQRAANAALRLYWVGQTMGPGKGLEESVEAAAMVGGGIELWVRGAPWGDFGAQLERMTREKNVPLTLLPHVHHDELAGTMGSFDVGLALERRDNVNASVTGSNKLFLYMLAGLAVAATDTPGQREVLVQAPAAGFVYPCGRPDLLASQLRRWRDNRAELRAAQSAAWQAAHDRFCWDVEKNRYLELLHAPRSRPAESPVS